MKYLYCKEVFSEVPGEITLALSISNCQIKCKGCNQKELWEDIGSILDSSVLKTLLRRHRGITCVLFMGSGNKEYQVLLQRNARLPRHQRNNSYGFWKGQPPRYKKASL